MEINGTTVRVYIKLTPTKHPWLAIATVIFDEWFEVKGFRLKETDLVTRLGNIWITPPALPPRYTPIFSTTAAGKDEEKREEKRRQYWYQLEELIFQAYTEKLNESPINNTDILTDKDIEEIAHKL